MIRHAGQARNTTRSGTSLIELLTVISVSAVLMTLCARWVVQTRKLQSGFVEGAQRDLTLHRLEDRFRRDLHAAHSVRLTSQPDDTARLDLFLPGNETVSFETSPGAVRWVRANSSGVLASDSYPLPDGRCRLELTPKFSKLVYEETGSRPTEQGSGSGHRVEIIAASNIKTRAAGAGDSNGESTE